MEAKDLLDIKPKQGKYKWLNKKVGSHNISARLDTFLVQISLYLSEWGISSSISPFFASDHRSVSLFIQPVDD